MQYPPATEDAGRGAPPGTTERAPDYVSNWNEVVLVVVMIETQKALSNLDQILSVSGIDAVFRQKEHPTFKAALNKALDSCKKHRVAPGMHCNERNISSARSDGFQFCALNDDDTFLTIGAKTCLESSGLVALTIDSQRNTRTVKTQEELSRLGSLFFEKRA